MVLPTKVITGRGGVFGRMRKEWNKEESEEDWTCIQGVGKLKQGSDPHNRAIVWDGEALEAVGE